MSTRPILTALIALTLAWRVEAAALADTVAQEGRNAHRVRETLRRIKLPAGFKIELYAMVPGARALAVGPASGRVFVGSQGTVYRISDRGPAREVERFAPSAGFKRPNGVCFGQDGTLFVAEQNRVVNFSRADTDETVDPAARVVVPLGGLIPASEESYNHSARVCRVGPDGKLYIALGQPYNVPPKGKLALYREWGIGGIIRVDRDGGRREVFATGIRNSVGLDFSPSSGDLWFTDNQVDGMGDDRPPGELNHATKPGQDFGFPWYGGGNTRTREYAGETAPAGVVFPAVEEVAHAADLGMVFNRGTMFPAHYAGAIFSAQHGSWNRSTPVGARVMVTLMGPDGRAERSQPFAEGWLDERSGQYDGRPVDVAQLRDGSLLVSDDDAGAVYRISYDGPQ